ncbi:CHAT domain-containing protein [Mycena vulgaris]|nr:CHAT domain-containing protein [Mycena vulgaris]
MFNPKLPFQRDFSALFWLGQKMDHRHQELYRMMYNPVLSEATRTIRTGDYAQAIELLDDGLCDIWSCMQALDTPVDDVRKFGNVNLADELQRVSRDSKLSIVALSTTYHWHADPEQREHANQRFQEHFESMQQYYKVLKQVRELPGFKDYRNVKQFSDLEQSAIDGPVVIINVNGGGHTPDPRCDALVITRPGSPVTHVPLPNFSHKLAEELYFSMVKYLHQIDARDSDASERAGRRARPTQDRLCVILECLWKNIVQPILEAIEPTLWELAVTKIPHITWCLTGPLTFLPLHAAGIYTPSTTLSISDFVVSSYTPNLTTLLYARARTAPRSPSRVAIVSQPNTPGQAPLPGVTKEVSALKKHFPDALNLDGVHATVLPVLDAMKACGWVHFACHGLQATHDPMQSAFALHDGQLPLSQIMAASLSHADLAVLSACQTATGDQMLAGEAAHLAGGMMAVGYRSVIATLWSIGDRDAPDVVDAFYAGILRGREGEKVQRAYALHDAVQKLRNKVGDKAFDKWVPFVHFGL